MADEGVPDPQPVDAAAPSAPAVADPPAWRQSLERDALWYALGALALGVVVVAIGVQVAPETFWDRFVWEDLYGPLVVDARQCHTAATCPGLPNIPGVVVKDGYTVTSELTYGVVLAVLLYGIYVGLFRRHGIVADGWFVGALLPWILLGPLARALEDANVFCRPGTDCDPGAFAYLFISPVIYAHVAVYVIAFLLLGVWLQHRRHADPRLLSGVVGSVLLLGFAAYTWVATEYAGGFSALPPLWFMLLACLGALALFHLRARRGLASVNLTVFVLGIPYAAGGAWLILRWLSGGVWSQAAWNGQFHLLAGAFILASALLVAAVVYALAVSLDRSRLPAAWGRVAGRVDPKVERAVGWAGVLAVGLAALMAGILPAFTALFDGVPAKETLIPALGLGGLALLVAFTFLHVGAEAGRRPHVFLLFAAGINLALVVGHMIDGLSTWVALEDPLGFGIPPYSEKHPFSEFLLRYWNGFLFPAAKLLMVLVVAWLMDRQVQAQKDAGQASARSLADEANLVGLVKMAIFVLGFAPGLRDLLRLSMGV
jgi:uncharacterized membrane protein